MQVVQQVADSYIYIKARVFRRVDANVYDTQSARLLIAVAPCVAAQVCSKVLFVSTVTVTVEAMS
jgi:hypothetical protein